MTQKISLRDNQSYDIDMGEFVKIRGILTRGHAVELVLELTGEPGVARSGDADIFLSYLPEKVNILARTKGNVDFPPEHSVIVTVEQPSGQAVQVELPETRLDGSPEGVVGVLLPSADGSTITVQALSSSVESNLSRKAMTTVSALRNVSQDSALTKKLHVWIDRTASAARSAQPEVLECLQEMVSGINEHYEFELVGDDISNISEILSSHASVIGSRLTNADEDSAVIIITDSPRPSMFTYARPTVALVYGPHSKELVRLFQEAYSPNNELNVVAVTKDTVSALQAGDHKNLAGDARTIANGLT